MKLKVYLGIFALCLSISTPIISKSATKRHKTQHKKTEKETLTQLTPNIERIQKTEDVLKLESAYTDAQRAVKLLASKHQKAAQNVINKTFVLHAHTMLAKYIQKLAETDPAQLPSVIAQEKLFIKLINNANKIAKKIQRASLPQEKMELAVNNARTRYFDAMALQRDKICSNIGTSTTGIELKDNIDEARKWYKQLNKVIKVPSKFKKETKRIYKAQVKAGGNNVWQKEFIEKKLVKLAESTTVDDFINSLEAAHNTLAQYRTIAARPAAPVPTLLFKAMQIGIATDIQSAAKKGAHNVLTQQFKKEADALAAASDPLTFATHRQNLQEQLKKFSGKYLAKHQLEARQLFTSKLATGSALVANTFKTEKVEPIKQFDSLDQIASTYDELQQTIKTMFIGDGLKSYTQSLISYLKNAVNAGVMYAWNSEVKPIIEELKQIKTFTAFQQKYYELMSVAEPYSSSKIKSAKKLYKQQMLTEEGSGIRTIKNTIKRIWTLDKEKWEEELADVKKAESIEQLQTKIAQAKLWLKETNITLDKETINRALKELIIAENETILTIKGQTNDTIKEILSKVIMAVTRVMSPLQWFYERVALGKKDTHEYNEQLDLLSAFKIDVYPILNELKAKKATIERATNQKNSKRIDQWISSAEYLVQHIDNLEEIFSEMQDINFKRRTITSNHQDAAQKFAQNLSLDIKQLKKTGKTLKKLVNIQILGDAVAGFQELINIIIQLHKELQYGIYQATGKKLYIRGNRIAESFILISE